MGRTAAPRRASTKGAAKASDGGAGARLRNSFVAALAADYEAHGAAAIAALREARPHDYVKLVAALPGRDGSAGAEGEEDGSVPIAIEVHFVGSTQG